MTAREWEDGDGRPTLDIPDGVLAQVVEAWGE
jgi:hypothetical protein